MLTDFIFALNKKGTPVEYTREYVSMHIKMLTMFNFVMKHHMFDVPVCVFVFYFSRERL